MKQITEKEFNNAKDVVNNYIAQLNKLLITNHVCICCKRTEIKPTVGSSLLDGKIKSTQQEFGSWSNGTVEKITFGYGSRHDMRSFYIGICDNCIDELESLRLLTDVNVLKNEEIKYNIL